MGSSASKASRAAGPPTRQYPVRPPPTSSSTTSATPPPPRPQREPGPSVRLPPQASGSRSDAINLDASDPDFAQSLRRIGPVQPNPTLSVTSAFPHPSNPNDAAKAGARAGPDPRRNPAIAMLEARGRLQQQADEEFMQAGKRGHDGRQFLDVFTIRQLLIMRDDQGKSAAEIEKALGLKKGIVDRLGASGVVGLAHETGKARKGVDMV